MDHPKDIGDRTTLAVMLVLREAGFGVLTPFGENTRYDLAIDDGCKLFRVQCKTGRIRQGAVRFAVCSCYGHHLRAKDARRDYQGQVDYFGVYCPDNVTVYLVPIADLSVRVQAALRVEPARNRQKRKIRLALEYEIGKVRLEAPRRAPQFN
jgi:PD-(D/E)XK endonuclease